MRVVFILSMHVAGDRCLEVYICGCIVCLSAGFMYVYVFIYLSERGGWWCPACIEFRQHLILPSPCMEVSASSDFVCISLFISTCGSFMQVVCYIPRALYVCPMCIDFPTLSCMHIRCPMHSSYFQLIVSHMHNMLIHTRRMLLSHHMLDAPRISHMHAPYQRLWEQGGVIYFYIYVFRYEYVGARHVHFSQTFIYI